MFRHVTSVKDTDSRRYSGKKEQNIKESNGKRKNGLLEVMYGIAN